MQTHAQMHSPFSLNTSWKTAACFAFNIVYFCIFLFFFNFYLVSHGWFGLFSIIMNLDPTFMPFNLLYVFQWTLALWIYYDVESSWESVRFSKWNLHFQGVINLEKNAPGLKLTCLYFAQDTILEHVIYDEGRWTLHLLNQTVSFYCLFHC